MSAVSDCLLPPQKSSQAQEDPGFSLLLAHEPLRELVLEG